jgi:hypothetical protein
MEADVADDDGILSPRGDKALYLYAPGTWRGGGYQRSGAGERFWGLGLVGALAAPPDGDQGLGRGGTWDLRGDGLKRCFPAGCAHIEASLPPSPQPFVWSGKAFSRGCWHFMAESRLKSAWEERPSGAVYGLNRILGA